MRTLVFQLSLLRQRGCNFIYMEKAKALLESMAHFVGKLVRKEVVLLLELEQICLQAGAHCSERSSHELELLLEVPVLLRQGGELLLHGHQRGLQGVGCRC